MCCRDCSLLLLIVFRIHIAKDTQVPKALQMVFVYFTCRLLERKEKHMTEFYVNTILLYKIIIGATIKVKGQ